MFNLSGLLDIQSKLYRRLVYGLVAMTIVLGIGVTTAQPSQANWLDLIFGGVQVIQLSNMSDRQEAEIGAGINRRLINSGQVKPYRAQTVKQIANGQIDVLTGTARLEAIRWLRRVSKHITRSTFHLYQAMLAR